MKKLATILFLCLSMIVTACGATPATPPQPATTQSTEVQPVALALTETLTLAPTNTLPASTPTLAPTRQPSRTPSAPATCPQVDEKVRPQFGPVFKGKKAAYHDARQAVLDFLNSGGNPQTALAKLAENGVIASLLDVAADGIPEFLLPSGYYTIFGCKDGKYQTLLDIAPTENTGYEPVPLVIDDLNQDGIPEIFIAQVLDYRVKYSLLAWDGAQLAPITPENYGSGDGNIFISNHDIYTLGQSHAEAGKINGNWQITDTNGDGQKEISVKAGVNANFSSDNLEEQMTLSWNGSIYTVGSNTIESTPTLTPTWTPLPFSKTCDYKASNVPYVNLPMVKDKVLAIQKFLNSGGDPQRLHDWFAVTVKDLTNDGIPEIILIEPSSLIFSPYIFSCINGSYESSLEYDVDRTTWLKILTIDDLNKNGLPEVVFRAGGCYLDRCGGLFIAEWDGKKFAGLIKDDDYGNPINYADMAYPKDAYVKDLDNDGISELVWVGGAPELDGDQGGMPFRVETHVYKWDGKNYSPQLVEYGSPIYIFQAVQDGDRYVLDAQFEKALKSYREAITNEKLGWWTEARRDYLRAEYARANGCAGKDAHCPPTPDLDEQPILQAYSAYRIMLTQILLGQPDLAENTYKKLLLDYSLKPGEKIITGKSPKVAAHPIVEMATAFWTEYQASKNMGNACAKAVSYAEAHKTFLAYIGSDYHGWQMQTYKPVDICPFK